MNIPIGNASGVKCIFTNDLNELYNKQTCSFVVTKSATMEPRQGNPEPRYANLPNGSINSSGLPNQGFKYYLDWAFNKREEEEKKKELLNLENINYKKIYLSIAGLSIDENICMIDMYNKKLKSFTSDIDFIPQLEINLSCPNVIGKSQVGYDFDNLNEYIYCLDANINGNYGFKLPPYFDYEHFTKISHILNKYDKCSFITCCNSLGNGLYIDTKTKTTCIKPKNGFGGIGGDYILPTAVANVNYFYNNLPNKKIFGCGGIKDGETALQHIFAGASQLQIGTALYQNGITVFDKITTDVSQWRWLNGEKNLNELIGCVKSQ
jgi:dihydroorotate dehydrogenase (fumarate)